MLLRCVIESFSLGNYLPPPILTNWHVVDYIKYFPRYNEAQKSFVVWLCFAQNEIKSEHL
jgi:hypothetical protein